MKIYEGTDGLRGLITKLIEVWNFKKITYDGEGSTISTNNVVFHLWVTDEVFLSGQFSDTEEHGWLDLDAQTNNLVCPCVVIYTYPDKRRWVIYKQNDLIAFGIQSNQKERPPIFTVIGEVTDYETQEKSYGLATSYANNNSNQYSVFTDGTAIRSMPYRPMCRRKAITSLAPVTSSTLNKGFTNLYHVLSHTSGLEDDQNYPDYTVPTQTVLLNGKKYLLSRFAFEIKE